MPITGPRPATARLALSAALLAAIGGPALAADAPPAGGDAAKPAEPAKPKATATSFQQGNEPGLAIDGNPDTIWHSQWNPYQKLPQSITIDQGEAKTIASVSYLPRPGGGNGNVTSFNLAVSTDDKTWTTVVDKGTWKATPKRKHANFAPVSARYVRLEVLTGMGKFASAAEISFSDQPIPDEPVVFKASQVSITAPAYGADIKGETKIAIIAPGLTSVAATSWKPGTKPDDVFGANGPVGGTDLDADGKGTFALKADELPHGPICVAIAGMKDGKAVDTCYLQLFNQGGVKWQQSLPKAPAAAEGMTEIFADDYAKMPSISSTDMTATYYDHKPPDGSQDFSSLAFTGRGEPGDPFFQEDTWLRIRADENAGSSGLISSMRKDGTGVLVSAPCYFECRFIGPNAPGAWPAFWLISDDGKGNKTGCDELDIIEAYGGEAPGSPNAKDAYCVTPHAWGQGADQQKLEQAALKQIRAGKGSAGMDGAMQVVKASAIGIPSTWYQAAHTYGCKITETDTIYYCDDIEIGRHSTLPISKRDPFFFLINMATGGGWPVDLSRYDGKADMWVDYVRVYSGNQADIDKLKKK